MLGVCGCWIVLASAAAQEAGPADRVDRVLPPPRVVPGLVLESSRGSPADVGPRLEAIGDGRLRHRGKGFTAIVDADGSVEFRDVIAEGKASLAGFDLRGRKSPLTSLPRDHLEERALYPAGLPTAPMMVGVGGGFGGIVGALIGALRRRSGGPGRSPGSRHTAAKLEFMRDTEGMRTRMAHTWMKARLATQLDALISEALLVWRDRSLSLVERRRRIFLKWDECEESGRAAGSAIEQLRADAAALARRRIEALVRLLAPAGSPQAFTPGELARLNAGRRSGRAFDPYAADIRQR